MHDADATFPEAAGIYRLNPLLDEERSSWLPRSALPKFALSSIHGPRDRRRQRCEPTLRRRLPQQQDRHVRQPVPKNPSERPLRRPSLPAGFAPFGIQAIGSDIVVAYAKQDSNARISVHASGHGVIDIYDGGGTLKKRLVTGGDLNVPWGIASAPSNFGPFSNKLLIGNFGDAFGNGLNAQPTNPLFFAAGPNRGTNGE